MYLCILCLQKHLKAVVIIGAGNDGAGAQPRAPEPPGGERPGPRQQIARPPEKIPQTFQSRQRRKG